MLDARSGGTTIGLRLTLTGVPVQPAGPRALPRMRAGLLPARPWH